MLPVALLLIPSFSLFRYFTMLLPSVTQFLRLGDARVEGRLGSQLTARVSHHRVAVINVSYISNKEQNQAAFFVTAW